MTCSKGSGKKNSLVQYLRAPLRVVIGIGDLCAKSLSGNVIYGNSMGCPTQHTPTLSARSCAAANSPSNHRAVENKGMMVKTSANHLPRSKSAQPLGGGGKVAPAPMPLRHSHTSVGIIGRIDEDEEETSSDCDEQ